jgi:hypothetical protein
VKINWHSPGPVWFENTAEESAKAFSYVLFSAMMAAPVHSMGGVNWPYSLSQAGFAALAAIFGSIASLRVKNGTASFLPRVVAAPPKSAAT